MQNPNQQYVPSTGADLPIMYVYLAGRIAGNCIEKCVGWRKEIVAHYANYNGKGLYPISFLDPLNSGESKSVDKLGLTSAIPPNLIYAKDLLSVERAHVVVANVEDYFEVGIENYLYENPPFGDEHLWIEQGFDALKDSIKNRRENFGTICEIAWTLYLQKPLILIVPETRQHIYRTHPFACRASAIVTSTKELLDKKLLNTLYKSISGATY